MLYRGTSNNTNKAAFRESYSMLHELRALAPSVKMIAVTATSTKHTRETIIDSLQMENPYIIYESPSKPNIAYSVCYMPKDESVDTYFQWLGKELKELGIHTTRTIIYCQTIKQCTIIYSTIKGMLGNKLFTGDLNDRRHVLMEMLHSCTPESNKNLVLEAFKDKDSEIRVLVATIAFGMGIDCKGVHRTIHFGPSKNIESYIQESGRAGRDGEQSSSFVLYQGLMLNHVNKDIKEYLRTNCCRRKHLLSSFDLASEVNNVSPKHLCCDICAKQCPCKSPGCGILTKFPYDPEQATSRSVSERSRAITDEQLDMILTSLYSYHKSLLKQLVQTSTSNVKKSNMKFLIGFSELQIDQVKKNCDKLFTIDDVLHYVEIWDIKHAHNILRMVSQTFGDVSHEYATNNIQLEQEESLEDNDDFDDWNYILEDDALFDLAMENLSASLLDVSMDDTLNCPNNADLPSSALDALELMTLNTSYID